MGVLDRREMKMFITDLKNIRKYRQSDRGKIILQCHLTSDWLTKEIIQCEIYPRDQDCWNHIQSNIFIHIQPKLRENSHDIKNLIFRKRTKRT